jgi:hypothetical protein
MAMMHFKAYGQQNPSILHASIVTVQLPFAKQMQRGLGEPARAGWL